MLSIVLPTYNEAVSIRPLIANLLSVLQGWEFEILVIDDDSPDHTWRIVQEMAANDLRIRVLRRQNERGLSSAVVRGFSIARGDILLVMDADGQHDVSIVPRLASQIREGAVIAVASRYMPGGSVGEWIRGRRILSRLGTWLAQSLPPVCVSDPMSGFFAISAQAYAKIASRMHPQGFKILFEILSCLPGSSRVSEVPLKFLARTGGESKLTLAVEMAFIVQVIRIACRRMLDRVLDLWVWIFIPICIALMLFFGERLWNLRLLFTDSHLRQQVQKELLAVADERGWLLSNIQLRRVSPEKVRFFYREHRRGEDIEQCFDLSLALHTLAPCVD